MRFIRTATSAVSAVFRPQQPIVSRADVRAASRTRNFQPRGARISRNTSTPTPTPPVRNRVKQTPNGNDRAWTVGRIWRRRHAHVALRARSVPTATPLVRKRITQTPTGNDRAHVVARAWRRKRAHIVLRAPQPAPPVPKPRQPLVSRADIRATARTRGFQPRGARIIRNVSTPTPTPLVKPTVFLSRNRGKAARVRAFFVRHPAQLVRPPILAAAPFSRHAIVVTRTTRAARVRSLTRRRVHLTRSVVFAPPARQTAIAASRNTGRAAHVRALNRHRGARIMRASVVQPVVVRQRQPIVTHSRPAVRVRYARPRATTLVRSNVYTTTTRTVATLVLGRNNRRPALVRSYYARHRSHLETSTLGAAAPPVVIVVGHFDVPTPNAAVLDAPSPSAASFDEPTPSVGAFDTPNPR